MPRALTHRLVLALPGVSPRQVGPAVGLQLARLSASTALGYSWRGGQDGQVEVWYWDEAPQSGLNLGGAAVLNGQPCPESLLRATPPEGISLIRCGRGFEAVFCRGDAVEKTRWFPVIPTDVEWAWFVQDTGLSPADCPLPAPLTLPALVQPASSWSFHTSLRKPLARAVQVGCLIAAVLGSVVCAVAVYDFKLSREVSRVEAELSGLSREAASALKLQRELDGIIARVGALSVVQPQVLQLQALARLAGSGLVSEASKVVLVEWEYRNDRVKMLFAVPPEKFVLSEFLTGIEKIGVFSDIRLLPGTPGSSVGLQAGLRRVSSMTSLPSQAVDTEAGTAGGPPPQSPEKK